MGLGDKESHLRINFKFTPKREIVIDPERKRTKNIIYIHSEERASWKHYEDGFAFAFINAALNVQPRVPTWALIFAVLVGLSAAVDNSACFQCRNLMNRDWRNDVLGSCSGTIDDCGECMNGYYGAPGEICQPRADKVQNSNPDVAFFPNGDAALNCKLTEPADCVWEKDGIQFPTARRLEYLDTNSNGINTKDCSILFRSMEVSDLGYYRCTSRKTKQDSSGNMISAAHIIIHEERTVVAKKDNPIAHVQLGETVIIPCHFQNPDKCVWRRGKNPFLVISGRYSYIDVDDTTAKTGCSIKIRELAAIDLKLWSCKGLPSNSHNEVASTSVTLKLVKPPSSVQSPKSISAVIGDSVVLPCMFDSEVQCAWMHNDSDVPIGSRYRFIEDNFSKLQTRRNCGIEILEFRPEDAGSWSCSYNGFPKTIVPAIAWLSVTMDNGSIILTTLPMQTVNGTNENVYQGQSDNSSSYDIISYRTNISTGVAVAIGIAVFVAIVGIVICQQLKKRHIYEVALQPVKMSVLLAFSAKQEKFNSCTTYASSTSS